MRKSLRFFFVLALFAGHAAAAAAGELHVFTSDDAGFRTNSVWYDDGKEVLVVDSQFTPQIAEKLLADIRSRTSSPVTRVVVTHPNPDKFNGLPVFHRAGATSIASDATAQAIPGVDAYKRHFWVNIAHAFTDDSYPKVEAVRETFSGKRVIHLKSGETITLFELRHPGVSSTQTVVRIDATGDLIVGDLVHYRTHAWLEGGIVDGKAVPTIAGWKAALRELPRLGQGQVYGGRGPAAPVQQAVDEQIAYLDRADAIVRDYVRGLGDRRGELSDPAKQGAHFAAIQKALSAAFPDYAMPDLVGYGVYGLAQQDAAEVAAK